MVNPTNVGYDFSWESQGNANPAWRCVTQRGMILAGKRGEMVFEFTPDDTETAEVGTLTTALIYSSLYIRSIYRNHAKVRAHRKVGTNRRDSTGVR